MLATNPFAALSIAPAVMQGYLILMIVLVAAGTLFDIVHKGSARYFFDNWRRTKAKAQPLDDGELVTIAMQTALVDVLAPENSATRGAGWHTCSPCTGS